MENHHNKKIKERESPWEREQTHHTLRWNYNRHKECRYQFQGQSRFSSSRLYKCRQNCHGGSHRYILKRVRAVAGQKQGRREKDKWSKNRSRKLFQHDVDRNWGRKKYEHELRGRGERPRGERKQRSSSSTRPSGCTVRWVQVKRRTGGRRRLGYTRNEERNESKKVNKKTELVIETGRQRKRRPGCWLHDPSL